MSTERIDTPENHEVCSSEAASAEKPLMKLNANAREFQPRSSSSTPALRPNAPEFVPVIKTAPVAVGSTMYSEVARLVSKAGVCGVAVACIPALYKESYMKELDLSNCSSSDLSVLLQEIPRLSVLDAALVPDSLHQALVCAGFVDVSSSGSGLIMGCEEWFGRRRDQTESPVVESACCPLGEDRDKVAVDTQVSQFVNELKTFKDSIVDVVAKSSIASPSGLPLSALASEWEKSFVAKGLVGMPDFTSLIRRFHVSDPITFLKCIPTLEIVQTNKLIIVKLREALTKSKSVVVLDQELFGKEVEAPVAKPTNPAIKQHISTLLVSQLIAQVEKQVLELGSHLAKNGLHTSPQDLVIIRLQLQQLQTLKTALKAVLNPVQVTPTSAAPAAATSSQSAYAALLSQAAQYAMSAISATKKGSSATANPVSGVSTAVSSKRSSPVASAVQELSQSDVRGLVVRILEKNSLPVSSISSEWQRMYPSLEPLDKFVSRFGFADLKQFFVQIPQLVVYYATLPSPQLRVATTSQFSQIAKEQPVTVINSDTNNKSPLLSPTSTCSFTSDNVQTQKVEQQASQKLLELILKQIRLKQISVIREKASSGSGWKELNAVLEVVKDTKAGGLQRQQSRLDSRRPPPIDTTDGSTPTIAPLMKAFVKKASEMVPLPSVSFTKLCGLLKSEDPTEVARLVQSTPGVRLVGPDRCTLAALSAPGAAVGSLFACNDESIWNSANEALIEALKKFLNPPATAQLNELSATLFRSIMSGGSKSAKECAGALKVLAAKDPTAIHEIVSSHITNLKQCDSKPQMEEAARAFVNSLMEKGKKLHDEKKKATLSELLGATLSNFRWPDPKTKYTKEELLNVKMKMEQEGRLTDSPPGLVIARLPNKLVRGAKPDV
jgi:hypothetical protein